MKKISIIVPVYYNQDNLLPLYVDLKENDIKRETKIYLNGNKKYYQNKNMKWQEFNLSKNKAKEILKYIDLTSNEVYEFNY